MKAIYGGVLYAINKHLGNGVELVKVDSRSGYEDILYVGFDNPGLVLDPTDSDIEEIEDYGTNK